MFRILGTIDEGASAAIGFAKAYPGQTAGFVLAYLAAAGLGVSGWISLPLPLWLSGLVLTWGLGTIALLLLAPVWTAIFRFTVLGDRSRRYVQFDVRTRRVAAVQFVMAMVMLVGAVPFALGLDVLPLVVGRRLIVGIIVLIAFFMKYVAFWLNARLAIAPAMAATGTRTQSMDTSWAYTRWASVKILVMLLLVFVPTLCVSGFFLILAVLLRFQPGSTGALVLTAATVIGTTLAAAFADFLWGTVSGRLAVQLVKANRQRAADLAKEQLDDRDAA